ncbi:MAG TPA: ATP-binding protein [Terriglobia bacterium]|nr:ATP-binding protein [Terriglobia bacterium]
MVVDTEKRDESPTVGRPGGAGEVVLNRVRLRARRRFLWMRSVWGNQPAPAPAFAISEAEVERLLEDPAPAAAREEAFYASDAEARQLSEQINAADQEFGRDETWNWLRRQFGLSDAEVDLLATALAVETDPPIRRVFGYLQDDATAGFATPWLAARLFGWPSRTSFGPDSALLRWRLARPVDGLNNPWAVTAPWVADPHMILWLTTGPCMDPALGTVVQFFPAAESRESACLYPDELAAMLGFLERVHQRTMERTSFAARVPVEVELVGPKGAGKRTLAAQFAATLGSDLLAVDAGALLGADAPADLAVERAARAVRMARLTGAALYWYNTDHSNPRALRAVGAFSDFALIGASTPGAPGVIADAVRRSFALPGLTRAARISLWKNLSEEAVPPQVAEWTLAPGEVVNASHVVAAGSDAVAQACQQDLHLEASELFAPLVCPFTWDDMVLPSTLRQHLAELEQQVRLRWLVYEEWGFGRLCPLDRGITAMFAGPSGTGKTMAAQVMARSLGMRLYRVDLAGVMNKYIGETEKRLKQVFDSCERANALLFFDEADALFGQRTQVKDAHDRFANIEIDYLLQRIEQFEGVAILATNRKNDLDKAFVRRIRFIIEFMHPGPSERLALWRRVLPVRSPQGEELLDGIHWEFLAEKLALTGAEITAAALGAAFLASADGTRIGMRHVLHAARREMTKQGLVLRAGDWEG